MTKYTQQAVAVFLMVFFLTAFDEVRLWLLHGKPETLLQTCYHLIKPDLFLIELPSVGIHILYLTILTLMIPCKASDKRHTFCLYIEREEKKPLTQAGDPKRYPLAAKDTFLGEGKQLKQSPPFYSENEWPQQIVDVSFFPIKLTLLQFSHSLFIDVGSKSEIHRIF